MSSVGTDYARLTAALILPESDTLGFGASVDPSVFDPNATGPLEFGFSSGLSLSPDQSFTWGQASSILEIDEALSSGTIDVGVASLGAQNFTFAPPAQVFGTGSLAVETTSGLANPLVPTDLVLSTPTIVSGPGFEQNLFAAGSGLQLGASLAPSSGIFGEGSAFGSSISDLTPFTFPAAQADVVAGLEAFSASATTDLGTSELGTSDLGTIGFTASPVPIAAFEAGPEALAFAAPDLAQAFVADAGAAVTDFSANAAFDFGNPGLTIGDALASDSFSLAAPVASAVTSDLTPDQIAAIQGRGEIKLDPIEGEAVVSLVPLAPQTWSQVAQLIGGGSATQGAGPVGLVLLTLGALGYGLDQAKARLDADAVLAKAGYTRAQAEAIIDTYAPPESRGALKGELTAFVLSVANGRSDSQTVEIIQRALLSFTPEGQREELEYQYGYLMTPPATTAGGNPGEPDLSGVQTLPGAVTPSSSAGSASAVTTTPQAAPTTQQLVERTADAILAGMDPALETLPARDKLVNVLINWLRDGGKSESGLAETALNALFDGKNVGGEIVRQAITQNIINAATGGFDSLTTYFASQAPAPPLAGTSGSQPADFTEGFLLGALDGQTSQFPGLTFPLEIAPVPEQEAPTAFAPMPGDLVPVTPPLQAGDTPAVIQPGFDPGEDTTSLDDTATSRRTDTATATETALGGGFGQIDVPGLGLATIVTDPSATNPAEVFMPAGDSAGAIFTTASPDALGLGALDLGDPALLNFAVPELTSPIGQAIQGLSTLAQPEGGSVFAASLAEPAPSDPLERSRQGADEFLEKWRTNGGDGWINGENFNQELADLARTDPLAALIVQSQLPPTVSAGSGSGLSAELAAEYDALVAALRRGDIDAAATIAARLVNQLPDRLLTEDSLLLAFLRAVILASPEQAGSVVGQAAIGRLMQAGSDTPSTIPGVSDPSVTSNLFGSDAASDYVTIPPGLSSDGGLFPSATTAPENAFGLDYFSDGFKAKPDEGDVTYEFIVPANPVAASTNAPESTDSSNADTASPADLSGYTVNSEVKSNVMLYVNPLTGQSVYLKRAEESEIDLTEQARRATLPPDAVVVIQPILASSRQMEQVPDFMRRAFERMDSSDRPLATALIITEGAPAGTPVAAGDLSPASLREALGGAQAPQNLKTLMRDWNVLNELGIFHGDLLSNMLIVNNSDGSVRFHVYDFEEWSIDALRETGESDSDHLAILLDYYVNIGVISANERQFILN